MTLPQAAEAGVRTQPSAIKPDRQGIGKTVKRNHSFMENRLIKMLLMLTCFPQKSPLHVDSVFGDERKITRTGSHYEQSIIPVSQSVSLPGGLNSS